MEQIKQSSFGRNLGGHQGGGEGKPEALAGTPETWGLGVNNTVPSKPPLVKT